MYLVDEKKKIIVGNRNDRSFLKDDDVIFRGIKNVLIKEYPNGFTTVDYPFRSIN